MGAGKSSGLNQWMENKRACASASKSMDSVTKKERNRAPGEYRSRKKRLSMGEKKRLVREQGYNQTGAGDFLGQTGGTLNG